MLASFETQLGQPHTTTINGARVPGKVYWTSSAIRNGTPEVELSVDVERGKLHMFLQAVSELPHDRALEITNHELNEARVCEVLIRSIEVPRGPRSGTPAMLTARLTCAVPGAALRQLWPSIRGGA